VAKYKGRGPDMLPAEPELAARVWLISRIHDVYISAVQARGRGPAESALAKHLRCWQ
jgi:hypothetical protein